MTTTDPTPLAEQIAREHPPRIGAWACWCGWMTDDPDEELTSAHVRHVATVTEQAVIAKLEEFAAAAEALARAEGHIWEDLADRAAGLREGVNHLRGDADA